MATPSSSRCTNCGAVLSAPEGVTRTRCTYCGTENNLSPETAPPVVIVRSGASMALVVGIVAVVALVMVGVGFWAFASGGAASSSSPVSVAPVAAPAGTTAAAVEDLAGPFVLESQGKLEVWVGVLDGTDFHLQWKSGPFGDEGAVFIGDPDGSGLRIDSRDGEVGAGEVAEGMRLPQSSPRA